MAGNWRTVYSFPLEKKRGIFTQNNLVLRMLYRTHVFVVFVLYCRDRFPIFFVLFVTVLRCTEESSDVIER